MSNFKFRNRTNGYGRIVTDMVSIVASYAMADSASRLMAVLNDEQVETFMLVWCFYGYLLCLKGRDLHTENLLTKFDVNYPGSRYNVSQ